MVMDSYGDRPIISTAANQLKQPQTINNARFTRLSVISQKLLVV
jgi:hypothetical protein